MYKQKQKEGFKLKIFIQKLLQEGTAELDRD